MSGIFFLDLKRKITQKMSKREQAQSKFGSFLEKCLGKVPKVGKRGARLDPEQGNYTKDVQKPVSGGQDWIFFRKMSWKGSKSRQAQS